MFCLNKIKILLTLQTFLYCLGAFSSTQYFGIYSGQIKHDDITSNLENYWHLESNTSFKTLSTNLRKTYTEFGEPSEENKVIVAVIDSGVDINHINLRHAIWNNKREIPDNGIDDDENGYVDDINGWNFLGEQNFDQSELTRKILSMKNSLDIDSQELQKLSEKLQYKRTLLIKELEDYQKDLYIYQVSLAQQELSSVSIFTTALKKLQAKYGSVEKLEALISRNINRLSIVFNLHYSPQKIIENNDVSELEEHNHGTHISGVIAAIDHNENAPISIAPNNSIIMPIKAIPVEGEERDEIIAKAIHYAVDNGAKIINLSFKKYTTTHPELLLNAIDYAEKSNVLIVNSAGNRGINIDHTKHYPHGVNPKIDQVRENWITVAASSSHIGKNTVARFSNIGRKQVDLFAPGVDIYSLAPNDNFAILSGTSMAAPLVTGAAVLLLSYKPSLSAAQLKQIITKSVRKIPNHYIRKHNSRRNVLFTRLSSSGGVLDIHQAVTSLHRPF